MVNSMTGFASATGQHDEFSWTWEIRSVNGKGLDVRIRVPEGAETIENTVRKAVSANCKRGTIYVNLKPQNNEASTIVQLNLQGLDRAVDAAITAKNVAEEKGLGTAPLEVSGLLSLRGVLESGSPSSRQSSWLKKSEDQFKDVLASFVAARKQEGDQLQKILSDQIEAFSELVSMAHSQADDRKQEAAAKLREKVRTLIEDNAIVDENRLEQELALLAVKSDITEELDRLQAHIEAAKDLLGAKQEIGRKFDFLMQEFNREANTLCSKSGSTELTRTGLEMKTLIDQMREQVQNIE